MNKNTILGVIIAVVLVAIYLSSQLPSSSVKLGAVNRGNEYQSLVLTPLSGGASSGELCSATPGSLGTVVVTGVGTGNLHFYNATTSNSAGRTTVATSSLTALALLPASVAVGDYIYDVVATRGLIWETNARATVPTTTITYRCN